MLSETTIIGTHGYKNIISNWRQEKDTLTKLPIYFLSQLLYLKDQKYKEINGNLDYFSWYQNIILYLSRAFERHSGAQVKSQFGPPYPSPLPLTKKTNEIFFWTFLLFLYMLYMICFISMIVCIISLKVLVNFWEVVGLCY